MSWDRDEAANQQEALDRLTESQRDLSDTLREYFSREHSDGYAPPRGGDGGDGSSFDDRGITEFNQALRDTVGPIRLFSRSLDMLSEKLEESLVQARDLQQAGSFNPNPKPNPQGAGQLPGPGGGSGAAAPLAFPTSPLFRPTSYMIPNQYGGFTTYSMGGAAAPTQQPITVPANTLNPGQVRRRQARRRSMMRKLRARQAKAKKWRGIAQGAYLGGIFGGVKGAVRGATAGLVRMAASSSYSASAAMATAGMVSAMPFMMAGIAASSERQVDTNRSLAMFSPETAQSMVRYDVAGLMRNIDISKATSRTAVNLIESQGWEREQQKPWDVMSQNVANSSATFFSRMSGSFFKGTAGLWEGVDSFVTENQKAIGVAGDVAGDAARGAMWGGAIGLLTIPFLGWFGPMLGAAFGSAIGAGSGAGKAISSGGGNAFGQITNDMQAKIRDGDFLDMKFAPRVRKI